MLHVSLVRALSLALLLGATLWSTGCTTPSATSTPAPTRAVVPTGSPEVLVQARFERLVEQVLGAEDDTTALLNRIQNALPRPVQAAVDRDLLQFLRSDTFTDLLEKRTVLTIDRVLASFAPENAAALRQAGLERPLLALVDTLIRLAVETKDMATTSEEGQALSRIFTLLHQEILPALVETRAIVIEEALDTNEAAALAQKMEEQLQSINDQLGSLKNRARSVTAPAP